MKQYTKTHEWIEIEENCALVGITDYAQKEMGDIVYAELPETGAEVVYGESVCELESVKAVAPVNSPATGKVVEVNGALEDKPELVNQSSENEGWLYKMEITGETVELMDKAAYEKYLKTL